MNSGRTQDEPRTNRGRTEDEPRMNPGIRLLAVCIIAREQGAVRQPQPVVKKDFGRARRFPRKTACVYGKSHLQLLSIRFDSALISL